MEGPSEALDHSLVAFVAIQIRLSGEVGVSYDEAIELYNHALSKVIHVLDCPCIGNNDESLAAIVILSTCEVGQRLLNRCRVLVTELPCTALPVPRQHKLERPRARRI